jgi:hypothetical protein
MAKYKNYIELSPNYESVVDINSDERNPDMWNEYIVNEDMRLAIEKIYDSIQYENRDARRSFWIQGAYGTGKSYAAIVIKHLFEESQKNVDKFFSTKQILRDYKNKFNAIREKGDFLVVWKSGTSDVSNGIQLMMAIEFDIRRSLEKKFKKKAYYGKNSLVDSVKEKVNDKTINWGLLFEDPQYGLSEEYPTFDSFKQEIVNANIKACNQAADICRDKGWALFNNVDAFEAWIKDIIEGNNLQNSGIIFIWDEFTDFVRESGSDNVLQRISEYCKQQPLFMFFIVHVDPTWVNELGKATYERILHRYHELEFHITESAAYDLIGNSILTRKGMDSTWKNQKDKLLRTIDKYIPEFDNLQLTNPREKFLTLCPIHPMTLTLLSTVAQNFGASQRTLFRFMKDEAEEKQNVGFRYFINTYGPDDWRWLTPDFLWDYFFIRESDIKGDTGSDARQCYRHYEDVQGLISIDDTAFHIFKAILLLIAVMSTEKTIQLRSQAPGRRIAATKKTLYRCFYGELSETEIDKYLDAFQDNNQLRLVEQRGGEVRLELPYSGPSDLFEGRYAILKKRYTRYEVFKKGGLFSKAVEDKMWDLNRNTFNRMYFAVCSSENDSQQLRLNDITTELAKNPYKLGFLIITVSETAKYVPMQTKAKELAENDETGRLIVVVLKEALTEETIDSWIRELTYKELASEDGKTGSADQHASEAALILGKWAQSAISGQMAAYYKDTAYPSTGSDDLRRKIEASVLYKVFPYAPEQIVTVNTAFRPAQESAATAGITLSSVTAQLKSIEQGVKDAGVWDINDIGDLAAFSKTDKGKAIAALAKHIHSQMTQGAKLKLDALWAELQERPFGYYNSLACAYLLGFVFRFYKNGQFNWIDSVGNPHILTEQYLASMVTKMCKNDLVNNTLSSGSETWQKFKDYPQNIFSLEEAEIANDEFTKRAIREKINQSGVPLWSIKYIESGKLGGEDTRNKLANIVDLFCAFIEDNANTEDEMSNIITAFKGAGALRKSIREIFENKTIKLEGLQNFITENNADVSNYIKTLGISPPELTDSIKRQMQTFVYTWKEDQVVDKLKLLSLEYEVVSILNKALKCSYINIDDFKRDLTNCFDNMKIPGSVIETLSEPWVTSIKCLYTIAYKNWTDLSFDQKSDYINEFKENAASAWDYICNSQLLLPEYFKSRGIACAESEINMIYEQLEPVQYNSSFMLFEKNVKDLFNKLSYERNRATIFSLWKEKTGQNTVSEWCKHYIIPVQWALIDDDYKYALLVKRLEENDVTVNPGELQKAIEYFEDESTLSILKDKNALLQKFYSQIGSNNAKGFEEYRTEILSSLRIQLGSDIYSWGTKAGEVRNTIEQYLRNAAKKKFAEKAKQQVSKMSESDLKALVLSFLEEHPEFNELFYNGRVK